MGEGSGVWGVLWDPLGSLLYLLLVAVLGLRLRSVEVQVLGGLRVCVVGVRYVPEWVLGLCPVPLAFSQASIKSITLQLHVGRLLYILLSRGAAQVSGGALVLRVEGLCVACCSDVALARHKGASRQHSTNKTSKTHRQNKKPTRKPGLPLGEWPVVWGVTVSLAVAMLV